MSKKLTVVEKFEDVMALLSGKTPEHGLTVADAVAFIEERKAQTVKKNTSGSKAERKPTATQLENVGIKEQIVNVLTSEAKAMTATEICKAIGVDSNHKVSALLTQLKKDEIVVREEVKGRAMFSIAPKTEDAE